MRDFDKYRDELNHKARDGFSDPMGQFLQDGKSAKVPEGQGKEAIWAKISEKLDQEEPPQTKSIKINPWLLGGLAAAVLLLIVFVLGLQGESTPQTIHIVAEAGIQESHELPDGSMVKMNAATSIRYSEDWDRKLTLTGEAFFEVEKGSVFTVNTKFGFVEVLGTSFNVFARDGSLEVTCKTGKVQVLIPERSIRREIGPEEQLLARPDTIFITSFDQEKIGIWASGEFYFDNRPIIEVMQEVERQYKTSITFKSEETIRFTGYFFKEAELSSTLELICLPLGLDFEANADGYEISRPEASIPLEQ
ncbi:MAG: FecR domain-containing protein [Bacteroidota bacterium]